MALNKTTKELVAEQGRKRAKRAIAAKTLATVEKLTPLQKTVRAQPKPFTKTRAPAKLPRKPLR